MHTSRSYDSVQFSYFGSAVESPRGRSYSKPGGLNLLIREWISQVSEGLNGDFDEWRRIAKIEVVQMGIEPELENRPL